ncbi:5-oxoprolinase subunit C family protein [Psychroserpens mesophilus]|uniref:5-oxoprolinase subunit C family protein n=1 Tax=Psychroserpens mesophilus TaxID=325473 RepID=UPI00058C255C|nr:biotin-dependent carboxyltransferase family protein [Psychroserpens mesophilus]
MVEVLKNGLYDSIQDLGRFDVQEYGVPFSGAMDLHSAKVANLILDNALSSAVLEITIHGPKLLFHCDTEIALSGADLCPMINSKRVRMNSRIQILKNDVLSFGNRNYGCRAYVAVKGGFQTEFIMNSCSMYYPITMSSQLKKGDLISISEQHSAIEKPFALMKMTKSHFEVTSIEVTKGIEYSNLSEREEEMLFSTEFTVSNDSNRMAYQVKESINNTMESIITSLVLPGTVQLTPSGKLLFLMRDCQTTGGYPRILQVSESSINQLSQKIFGDKFRLKCID